MGVELGRKINARCREYFQDACIFKNTCKCSCKKKSVVDFFVSFIAVCHRGLSLHCKKSPKV